MAITDGVHLLEAPAGLGARPDREMTMVPTAISAAPVSSTHPMPAPILEALFGDAADDSESQQERLNVAGHAAR